MGLPTCLAESDSVLIVDASTVINLNATGCVEVILEVLPYRIAVVDVVAGELEEGAQRGRLDARKLSELVSANLVAVVHLGSQGLAHFECMVIGAASETLDDGEAATIAHAAEANAVAIIDERKATRLCATRFPNLRLGCTVDLLAHPAVRGALGPLAFTDAVYGALRDARMRVFPHHLDGIVELLGPERAARCTSLPSIVRTER